MLFRKTAIRSLKGLKNGLDYVETNWELKGGYKGYPHRRRPERYLSGCTHDKRGKYRLFYGGILCRNRTRAKGEIS